MFSACCCECETEDGEEKAGIMRDARDYKNTIEFVSEKVHNAWMDERIKQGFHAPADCPLMEGMLLDKSRKFKPRCVKCHSDLYPYSELPETIKDYDRVTVVAVLNAVNYFEGMTCKDCGYYEEGNCGGFGICETFAPRGLVEESL
jgi:predicted nucleic-acid-binding Zn-ribbon protein